MLANFGEWVVPLDKINEKIDIEPLLLVYFSDYQPKSIPKDILSRVSKNFYKEMKMNYRSIENIEDIFATLFRFFSLKITPNETILSFFQFNTINLCD